MFNYLPWNISDRWFLYTPTFWMPDLILEKEPVFPFKFWVLNKGTTGTIFYETIWYDAVLDWGLNLGPPALEASTLPLGYCGGGPWLGIETGTSRTQSQHWDGIDFVIEDLLSLWFQTLSYKCLHVSLFCSYKYNWCRTKQYALDIPNKFVSNM